GSLSRGGGEAISFSALQREWQVSVCGLNLARLLVALGIVRVAVKEYCLSDTRTESLTHFRRYFPQSHLDGRELLDSAARFTADSLACTSHPLDTAQNGRGVIAPYEIVLLPQPVEDA